MVTAGNPRKGRGNHNPEQQKEREGRKRGGQRRGARTCSTHLPENIRDLRGETDTMASKDFKLTPPARNPAPPARQDPGGTAWPLHPRQVQSLNPTRGTGG